MRRVGRYRFDEKGNLTGNAESTPNTHRAIRETRLKILFVPDTRDRKSQSAALGLLHEIGHFYREKFHDVYILAKLMKERFEEENNVTRFFEAPAARRLNEFIRTSYHPRGLNLEYFKPVSVTSTEEKKEE